MSEEIKKVGFGYVDDTDESLKSKTGGKFGLNTPAFLTKFEFNANAGSEGSLADALDMTVQIGDREFRHRTYPSDKIYDKDNNEITDKNSDAYKLGYNEEWTQRNAVIVHVLKCFVPDETVRQALATPANSFKDFVAILTGLLPAEFNKKPLDAFLEYQWTIPKGEDRTYLQLPKNMKGGYFLIPTVAPAGGTWKELRTDKGLRYVDANNAEHPFTRDANFMSGNKANQQIEGQEQANATLDSAAKATEGTW